MTIVVLFGLLTIVITKGGTLPFQVVQCYSDAIYTVALVTDY